MHVSVTNLAAQALNVQHLVPMPSLTFLFLSLIFRVCGVSDLAGRTSGQK